MRKFETLLLLSPELAADAREALLGTFTGVIERARRSVLRGSLGYARPRLPCPQANARLLRAPRICRPRDTVAELERIIRISDGAFKFLTVKLADAAEEVA